MATERVTGAVTARPTGLGIAGVWMGSLAAVLVRRPPVPGPRHSAGLRHLLLPLAVMEIVTAFLVSSMLPPAVRPAHAVLEVLLVLAGFGLVAALLRHPHEVDAERVVLRTGFLGDVTLPRAAVRTASSAIRTVPGRGPRPVPGEADAVACSVDSSLNAAVHLDPPVRLDLGAAGVVNATTVYTSVDSLPAFSAALRTVGPAPGHPAET
ncbi:hypothetical protein AMK16_01210 [Streptomyces sp. CB00455]|uniref:hypothetical protein n=1 Tax=Streptomyces sp. CB00455 TaxID=1703927 RepID=UPI000938AD4C|nr:hypothetical protein [Streptomyces sp. CB00455]OKK21904.1 hypothetical protein AMK16_01210 [Streptomyces sp. CB00455]